MNIKTSLLIVLFLTTGCGEGPKNVKADTSTTVTQKTNNNTTDQLMMASQPMMQPNEFTDFVQPIREPTQLTLICPTVQNPPTLDGNDNDYVWSKSNEIITLDKSSMRQISLKAVHHNGTLYLFAKYPDQAPSTTHKTWIWDNKQGIYLPGNDREDTFVLKWATNSLQQDLSFGNAEAGMYDVWFWKANRTNPSNYFDDKYHILSKIKNDTRITRNKDSDSIYLERQSDQGSSAYQSITPYEKSTTYVKQFTPKKPTGSRADIACKAIWKNGYWYIEFKRSLNTNNAKEDVLLEKDNTYLFGVSLYEMAGLPKAMPKWTQPLYRTGDVYDKLYLEIK